MAEHVLRVEICIGGKRARVLRGVQVCNAAHDEDDCTSCPYFIEDDSSCITNMLNDVLELLIPENEDCVDEDADEPEYKCSVCGYTSYRVPDMCGGTRPVLCDTCPGCKARMSTNRRGELQ